MTLALTFVVLYTSLQISDAFRNRGGSNARLDGQLATRNGANDVASDETNGPQSWGMFQEVDISGVESTLKARQFELMQGETIGLAYKKGNDYIVLTNKRYIHIDVWKVSSKITYRSVAWSSVVSWSVESAGTRVRPHTELRIWTDMPAFAYREHRFANSKANIYKTKKYITDRVLGFKSPSLIKTTSAANKSNAGALPQWLTDDSKEVDAEKVEQGLRASGWLDILQDDEKVDMAFRSGRDMMVFTSKRIIDIDIKGVGSAVEFKSLPFKYVRAFSIEKGIFGDKDVEMSIWTPVAGYNMHRFDKEFNEDGTDIFAIGAYLSSRAFKVQYTYEKKSSLLQESEAWLEEALAWLGNNASEVDPRQAEAQFRAGSDLPVLLEGENVIQAYKVDSDATLMTDYRILFIDVQDMKGKKIVFKSLPYTSIRAFAVESAGGWDADPELYVWTDIHYDPPACSPCGVNCKDCNPRPGLSFVSQDFQKAHADIFAVSRLLSSKMFGQSGSSLAEAGAMSNNSEVRPGPVLPWLGEEVDAQIVQAKFSSKSTPILMQDETVEMAFRVGRGFTALTNKRILFVDKQGASRKKVEYLTVPYSSVTGFAVESVGSFYFDAQMKFYTAMWWEKSTIKQDLRREKTDIQNIINNIAGKVLRSNKNRAHAARRAYARRGGRKRAHARSLLEENAYSSEQGPGSDVMAWLSNNAKEIDPSEAERKIRESTSVLLDDENVRMAYKVGRDSTLLTTKRLLYVEVKGWLGKRRIEWTSLPWHDVKSYKITTAAREFDNVAEFKVCSNSIGAPMFKQDLLKGSTDIHALEDVFADQIFSRGR